jgi:hypothetical protein
MAPVDLGDVAQVGHVRPVLLEDAAGVGVGFGVPDDLEPGALEAEFESADTGEQPAGGQAAALPEVAGAGCPSIMSGAF